ncbi:carbohydrate-binding protein [Luteimicrobium subarcticum]|uniref:Carbohydrate binding protein n=1 Tax=Luteimicrobium subarcticum TaxID=620910 RepID=A0A2M8WW05_9MICO|nr:carbohydrate-binding protein [Luteimicrobium subarcticum]PJI95101.1 carbohydrate binding protein [Luteimicrobium subarcticum]
MYDLPARHRTLRPLAVGAVVAATAITIGLTIGHASDARAQVTVRVANADELRRALADAEPGQTIELADGTYVGNWSVVDRPATSAAPVTLSGGRRAVLRTGTGAGAALHLVDSDYWSVRGITVEHGQEGVLVEASDHVSVEGVLAHDLDVDAVRFWSSSSFGSVVGSTISDIGQSKGPSAPGGVVVGSPQVVSDTSDHVTVADNVIGPLVGGPAVVAHEGTAGGTVARNVLDGAAPGGTAGEAWVEVRGNEYTLTGNTGAHAGRAGYAIGSQVAGWGCGTEVSGNAANLEAATTAHPIAIEVVGYDRSTCPTTVYDDNTVTGAGRLVTAGVPVVAAFGQATDAPGPSATAAVAPASVAPPAGAQPAVRPTSAGVPSGGTAIGPSPTVTAGPTASPTATATRTAAPVSTPVSTPTVTVTVEASPPATASAPSPTVPARPRCTAPAWQKERAYKAGSEVTYGGYLYRALWWNQGNRPERGAWSSWVRVRSC